MPQAARQVGDFMPSHLCSEIMKEAPRNCTCQICQRLKARGDHFDSFQQPFCWSPRYYSSVFAEKWRLRSELCVSELTQKDLSNVFVAFRQVWERWLYIPVRRIVREGGRGGEREGEGLNTCWICTKQTVWSHPGLVSEFLFFLPWVLLANRNELPDTHVKSGCAAFVSFPTSLQGKPTNNTKQIPLAKKQASASRWESKVWQYKETLAMFQNRFVWGNLLDYSEC